MKPLFPLVVIFTALLLARAVAWPTMLYSDAEVVRRAELIVSARVKEGSIKKIMIGGGSSYEHHAILIISSVIKGEFHEKELPVTISYRLLPVSARQEKQTRQNEDAIVRSRPEEPGESTIIHEDNPSEGFGPRVSGDVHQEQIWLLHRLGPPHAKDNPEVSPAGAIGISDPEDLQPKKARELAALLHAP